MKQSTIKQINEHLAKARAKHTHFAPCGPMQVVSIATEELGEMAKEVNDWVNKPDMLSDYNVGWMCPKCGSIYGPNTQECYRCNRSNITNNSTEILNKTIS